ncbi:MAG: hypothetical protein KR126chlam6_01375 [Candidatus Anoxychlamydiales bacterium]|nr:hypothetical protein [Candidatus Anoxychlamydiales bacterium]
MKKILFLICVFTGFCLNANEITEDKTHITYQTWIISDHDLLETILSPYTISEFSDLLFKEGIELQISYNNPIKSKKVLELPKNNHLINPTLFEETIFENSFIKICMPLKPLTEHHLMIVSKTSKKKISEMEETEAFELFKTIQKIGFILKNTFGYPGFVISRSNQNPNHCNIIPSFHKNFEVRDALEKAQVNKETLFPMAIIANNPNDFSKEKISEMVCEWQSALANFDNIPVIEEMKNEDLEYAWKMITTNNDSAKYFSIDCIFNSLTNLGIGITKNIHKPFQPIDDNVVTYHKGCVFCKKEIINYQKCFEYNGIIILYNHTSPSPRHHFMVIPKRHVKNVEELTDNELKTIHLLETILLKILEEKVGHSEIRLFVQNDAPSVGQTVPHFHDKIVVIHNENDDCEAILFSIFTLKYIQNSIAKVSPDEMKCITMDIQTELEKRFLLD